VEPRPPTTTRIIASRCYDVRVRTTIDLPEDLLARAKAIARDTSRTLSEVVSELVRRGLEPPPAPDGRVSDRTGLPLVSLGRTITSDDVRVLEDEGT
jgi:hypothetical protein